MEGETKPDSQTSVEIPMEVTTTNQLDTVPEAVQQAVTDGLTDGLTEAVQETAPEVIPEVAVVKRNGDRPKSIGEAPNPNGERPKSNGHITPFIPTDTDPEEVKPFLGKDVESQQTDADKAKAKAAEAGDELEDRPQVQMDQNEYWTDDEEEEAPVDLKDMNLLARFIIGLRVGIKTVYNAIKALTKGQLMKILFIVGYFIYFFAAMVYDIESEPAHRLLAFTVLGVLIVFWGFFKKASSRMFVQIYGQPTLKPEHKAIMDKIRFGIRWFFYIALLAVMIYVLIDEGKDKPENLRSLPGLFLFIVILMLFCPNPHKINWHTIYWGMGLQFILALGILKWKTGKESILWVQDRLDEFFDCTQAGSELLFGKSYRDHFMIFGALPIIFFTNAMLTILYYLGVIQWIVKCIGGFLNFVLDTSPTESTAVAASVFLEGTNALLTMRKYLGFLSKSQLFLVISACFSSLGGAYLAMLSGLGISMEYLLGAMVISAPATFVVCKLMVPETKWTQEKDKGRQANIGGQNTGEQQYQNVLDAGQSGAIMMLNVAGVLAVVVFAFFSFIEWINNTLAWIGDRVGVDNFSIELISSYLLYPIGLMMGVEPDDCRSVGMLLGYRIGMSNMVGYIKLRKLQFNKMLYGKYMMMTNFSGPVIHDGDDIKLVFMNKTLEDGFISDRSEAIVTYAMCGFSSFMVVVMLMGIVCAMVPHRRKWVMSMVIPGLVAGNVANFMTGCFASLFF